MSPEELLSLGLSNILAVIGIAASPIFELRGAIPVAIIRFHFPWYYAFLLAIVGNLLPVPFILLFLDSASRLLSKVGLFNRILNWLFERTRRRGRIVERYERIGLTLFVAIPLPITGVWTGSLAAVLFGLKFKHAILSMFIGILIAGTIVTCGTLLGWTIFSLWKA
ncbi:COG2426 family protein [Chloroflexota bacterium]